MQFFTSVLLLFSLLLERGSTAYIRCSSNCPKLSLTFADPRAIPDECLETNNVTDIYELALLCTVDYRIDYDAQRVYITLKGTNETKNIEANPQSQYLVQTMWLGFRNENNQPNITQRYYECALADDCARRFYLETIERLLSRSEVQLQKIRSKLYAHRLPIRKLSSRRCIDNKRQTNRTAVPCADGLCFAYYPLHGLKRQECHQDYTPTFFSEMEYRLPHAEAIEREVIEYKCNKHLCNRNEIIYAIRRILRHYTGWHSAEEEEEVFINIKSFAPRRTVSLLVFLSLLVVLV